MNILFLGNRLDIPHWLEEQGCNVSMTTHKIDADFASHFDWIISHGYRHIIKKDIINAVSGRIINLHISYLPWNRGASPNYWSFVDDTPKGVTIHYIDEGIDTGDIIAQKLVVFSGTYNLRTTYEKLQTEIIELFKKIWDPLMSVYADGEQTAVKQIGKGSFHMVKDTPEYMWIFRDIDPDDYYHLYEILKERDPAINISHRELPTYEQHCEFWRKKPYMWSQAIVSMDDFIGYVYLTDRKELGVHIKKEFQQKGIGTEVIKKVLKKFTGDILINIAPSNSVALKIASKLNFEKIQFTFRRSSSSGVSDNS